MDHLAINYDYGMAAIMDYMVDGKYRGMYRVTTRDLDTDQIVAVRYWPESLRDVAIRYADGMVDGKTINSARSTVKV